MSSTSGRARHESNQNCPKRKKTFPFITIDIYRYLEFPFLQESNHSIDLKEGEGKLTLGTFLNVSQLNDMYRGVGGVGAGGTLKNEQSVKRTTVYPKMVPYN